MRGRDHWNRVYGARRDGELSWFEALPAVSLRLLEAAGLGTDTCVVDIGGGDSRLVDQLSARGLRCLAVLDVSEAALNRAKARLGPMASHVTWIEADVTDDWTLEPSDIWHDRAVFHFLTRPLDRSRYRSHLVRILKPGGSAILATFAPDGPASCSGLPVQRYSAETLTSELGPSFDLVEAIPHEHITPLGRRQPFVYCRFRRRS